MDRTLSAQSLLPWLDAGASKLHLKVSLQMEADGPETVLPKSPFRLLDSSSPLLNFVHASYATPAGKSVKDVYLLVQKDQYSFSEHDLPFHNPAIDSLWLDAFAADGAGGGMESLDFPFASLGQNVSLDDSPLASTSLPLWRSLFYCQKRELYFHPPCPKCGDLLELCSDDGVLQEAGLPAYSSSLERFLYCPGCQRTDAGGVFYIAAAAMSVAATSPSVKDCQGLIEGFGQLVRRGGLPGNDSFPCLNCPEREKCYGSSLATSRIYPFAFYPFRMLVVDGAQMAAVDFISLLSGASVEELKKEVNVTVSPGRMASLETLQNQQGEGIELFFANDPRSFLEILYLKLAFLEQVSSCLFVAQKHQKHPELKLTMDQFLVNIPENSGMLPSFWNFKVKAMGLGIHPGNESTFLKVPNSMGLYSLALSWLATLLVNSKQSAGEVQGALAKWLEGEAEMESEKAFSPQNIFYHPEQGLVQQSLPVTWFELWQQSLGLGISLLRASFQQAAFSPSDFSEQLRQLSESVKSQLFSSVEDQLVFPQVVTAAAVEVSAPVDATVESKEDVQEAEQQLPSAPDDRGDQRDSRDDAILDILLELKDKWQEEQEAQEAQEAQEVLAEEPEKSAPDLAEEQEIEPEPEAEAGAEPEQVQEPEIAETIVISPERSAELRANPAAVKKTTPIVKSEELSAIDVAPEPQPAEAPSPEDDLDKTVILNADQLAAMMATGEPKEEESVERKPDVEANVSAPVQDPEGDLEKTVIMNLNDLSSMLAEQNPSTPPVQEETKDPKEPLDKSQPAVPPVNESINQDLSETVIISVEELEKLKKGQNGNK